MEMGNKAYYRYYYNYYNYYYLYCYDKHVNSKETF